MKTERTIRALLTVATLAALVAASAFAGYTRGYEQRVELVESYVESEHKIILPVAEPTGSKIESFQL